MSKKILAVLLSLSMIGSAVGMPVFADEVEAETVGITETVEAEETDNTDDELEVDSNSEVTLMAAEDTVTYPIEKDKTFSFENIDIVAHDVTGLNNYIDYVIYYKDGSAKEYNWSAKPNTLSVPTGGKIIITSTDSTVNAVAADEYFIVDEEENPVFHKVEAKLYESYTYTNTSKVSYKLLSNGHGGWNRYYDYVIYDADGNVSSYIYNSDDSSIEIPAGYSMKITVTSNPVTFNGIYEKFNLVKNDEPVMKKITASAGETYTYINSSNTAYKILSNGHGGWNRYYDYVIYDADGNVSSYIYNSDDSSIEIPAGYSMKITVTSNPVTFNGIYEKFNLVKNDEPVMKKITASAGETYTYINSSNTAYKILSNGHGGWSRYYDYVIYDADGNVSSYIYNSDDSSIEIPAGYSMKITVTSNPVTFNGIYEKFNLVKNDEPVMKKIIASAGETYTYTNNSNTTYKIISNGHGGWSRYYDYVIYYSNSKVKETVSKSGSTSVEVPAGGRIKITVTNNPVTFNGLDEAFDIDNNSAEMPSYKITNTDTIDSTMSVQSGYSYNYAVYDADNALVRYDVSSTAEVTIPKGGYAIATVNSNVTNPFNENDKLKIESRTNPVYRTTYINAEETYKYTNNSSRDLLVYKNGLSCDYVVHNADGSISTYAQNSTDGSFSVPAGGDICMTAHVYLNVKGLFDYFTAEKLSTPVFNIVSFNLGETYRFTNNAIKDMNLSIVSSVYDYVIYGADNAVSNVVMNSTSNSLTIPSGSSCVITPQTSNITVYALNEAFSAAKRNYPVLTRMPVYYGETITMNNLSDENRSIYSSVRNYIDYATYDIGNNAQDGKELTTVSLIEVPANGKAEITARASNDLFAGLYECFAEGDFSTKVTGVELSQSTLTLAPNKQAVLKATVLPTDATNKTVTWSSSNTSVAVVAQTGKVTAKAVGTATITATTADSGHTASCIVTVSDGTTPISTPTPTQKPDEPTPPVTDGAVVKVSSVTASAGNTVNVTVDLSGNKGFANLGIQVGYDANNLTLTSVTNNASVGATYTGAQSINANPYNMGWDSTSNITYNGNLATLTFKVKENAAEGKYPITVSYYTGIGGGYMDGEDVNYDADFQPLNLNYVNGAITVSSHIAGDINSDGKVNNQDGTFLLRHLAGWNVNVDESALDVNGDGRVNNQDGTVLLRYLAGWSVTIH